MELTPLRAADRALTGPDAVPRPAVIPVEDLSQVGEARRAAVAVAQALGFDETARGRVALVVTEAATNLARHARGGVIVVQAVCADGHAGGREALERACPPGRACRAVEVLAIDRGPGMADPARCLADGYSTGGTAGQGLGAIRRTADQFDLDSHPGRGTVLMARLRAAERGAARRGAQVGAVCMPLAGEPVPGDAWALVGAVGGDAERVLVVVADGLGHGVAAAEAAELATRTATALALRDGAPAGAAPALVLAALHAALRATRGAAVAVAHLDGDRALRFAGIGNVAATVVPNGGLPGPDGRVPTRSLVSHNGIVGHQARTPQEFPGEWGAGALLVLATDGVRPQWRLGDYPGLARRHPAIVAATLWRDHARGRDDATVVVVRAPEGGASETPA